jgi:purine-binding chemotaxis protein CheW
MTSAHPRTQEQLPEDSRELLDRRAERLRARAAASDDDHVVWVAEFPLGSERYAIPLTELRAALPLKMVTPVPLSPPHVVGILRFQGEVICALSLAAMVGASGWREDPAVLLVVDPGHGRLAALDCERVPKPIALPLARVEAARASQTGPVIPVTTAELESVNLLDLARLLDRRRGPRDAG